MPDRRPNGTLNLYGNDYKESDGQPEYKGNGSLTKSALALLNEEFAKRAKFSKYHNEEAMDLTCTGWMKSNSNGPFVFITFEHKLEKGEYQKKGGGDMLSLNKGQSDEVPELG